MFIGSLCCTVNFVIILCFTSDVLVPHNDEILYTTDTISDNYGFNEYLVIHNLKMFLFFRNGALNAVQPETI